MAAGGGLYLTAVFGTVLILIALAVLGRMEKRLGLKLLLMTYEVIGPSAEAIIAELNRVMDAQKQTMQNVRAATSDGHSRIVFSVDASEEDQKEINTALHESDIFSSVASISSAEHE
jgi:putative Mg2+ transporter-C (MgtC) family protein